MKYALQQEATSCITGFQNIVSSYTVSFFVCGKLTIQEDEVLIKLIYTSDINMQTLRKCHAHFH